MATLDFDKLPPQNEAEELINAMDSDETLQMINTARRRQLDDPNFEPTEEEISIGIMLVRRLRSLRETKKTRSAGKKPAVQAFDSLTDLL